MKIVFLLMCLESVLGKPQDLGQVVFTILSQSHPFHAKFGNETKNQLVENLKKTGVKHPQVFTLHDDLPVHGAWTILPLIRSLKIKSKGDTKWFVFLSERTEVDLNLFQMILAKHSPNEEVFVGHALQEEEPSIFCQPDTNNVFFPDLKAGFLLSKYLVNTILELLNKPKRIQGFRKLYTAHPALDLALILIRAGGPIIEHEPLFCTKPGVNCATKPYSTSFQSTHESIRKLAKETLFAVKTCHKNHEKRLTILMKTWGPAAYNLLLASEVEDPVFKTEVLPGAEENTLKGHCQKTNAILNHFVRNETNKNWKWLVIVDDDTILSVSRILGIINCYRNRNQNQMIAIGERYGFKNSRGIYGYDFPTGGGGIILNRKSVESMIRLSDTHCKCPKRDFPDDIHVALCIANLGITFVHAEGMHQERPEDYNKDRLEHQQLISFHKHDNTNPLETYDLWFREADEDLRKMKLE